LQSGAQGLLVDEEVEQVLAVERDDGDPLQVTAQQLVVAFDVDLLERMADALQGGARVVAEVAARAAVENEAAQSPRSPLAYASRSP
jgi:hypothetical protein